MQIHVVQQGETIGTIADLYGISVEKLIQDNELTNPTMLVVGQSLIVAFPELTYTVVEGDTLQRIAEMNDVSVMQLYRNNPFLAEREFLYTGEILVIKYDNTKGQMAIHGNAYPFINSTILKKTLPYLTYLSIINYTATTEGEIVSYNDDTDIIRTAKDYSVMPLMLLTTLTLQGEANIRVTYELLLNEDFQNKQIDNILRVLKEKGYYGINIAFQNVNPSTISSYEKYLEKVHSRLSPEGYYIFVTISPGNSVVDSAIFFEKVNYTTIAQLSDHIIFMNFEWASNLNAPSPVISMNRMRVFFDYVTATLPGDNMVVGLSTIGYDWQLPYVVGISSVRSLTINNAINLASNVGAVIRFDEPSQTPYFLYTIRIENNPIQHVVWFIDARSINSVLDLVVQDQMNGTDIWNIMNYDAQLWLVINTQYEIIKVL